jgi:uncharacterized RDD family membrane protein YckC
MRNYKLAGLWARIGGGLIDLIIVLILCGLVMFGWGYLIGYTGVGAFEAQYSDSLWRARGAIVGLLIDLLYTVSLQAGIKQSTWGQRAVGVKLTTASGETIGVGRAFTRYLVSVPSSLFFKLGYAIAIFTKNKQTLHDLAAGTIVVMADQQPSIVSTQTNTGDIAQPAYVPVTSSKQMTINSTSTQPTVSKPINEEVFWEQAANEVESAQRKAGLWAKCFVEASGDENKTKVEYLKQRVSQLVALAHEENVKQKTLQEEVATLEKADENRLTAAQDAQKSTSVPTQQDYDRSKLISLVALILVVLFFIFQAAGHVQ